MIDRLFETIAANASEFPDRPAIFENDQPKTYKQFENAIQAAAAHLQKFQIKPGDRIGIRLENGFETYAFIYATMLLGATFVPLSPFEPDSRLATIIKQAQMRVLVGRNIGRQDFGTGIQILELDEASEISSAVEQKVRFARASEDPAVYLMFTSGTTGSPKGIVISESNLKHFCEWALSYFSISRNDVFLGHIQPTFDLSIFHLLVPFLAGAAVRITPPTLERIAPGPQLQQGVTIAMMVPRMTGLLADAGFLKQGAFPNLRHLLFCGEKLFARQIEPWQMIQPSLTIHNLYGPTEATVACSCHTLPPAIRPTDPVPIGRAIGGMSLSIRNGDAKGELMISGPQLSRFEYVDGLNSSLVTRAEISYASGDLAELDSLGNFVWHARLDDQIKILGHRVELSEIEMALASSSRIDDVVCAFDSSLERIFAFYTAPKGIEEAEAEKELRSLCKSSLPSYMHPQAFKRIEKIPLTKNGKTDRAALLVSRP